MRLLPLICVLTLHQVYGYEDDEDEPYDPYTTTDPKKREPSPCEVCKFFISELKSRLAETAKSKAVIETGYSFVEKKKKTPYKMSELRLTEALQDPHICEKILEYNVHAERKGSLRYAKGMSETFSTLHGLVDKGVKVELGIPYDLWDKPSAEVTKMQRTCFKMAESYEDDIEDWYYNYQDTDIDLMNYICRDRYLKDAKWDASCLDEEFVPKPEGEEEEEEPESHEEEKGEEKDPSQSRKDKEKIDRLIQEQAEEQRLGHKLYKGEVGSSEEERLEKERKKKNKKKKKKNKKGDPGHDFSKDEL